MIRLIQGAHPGDDADILDKMFRLRAKVFNDRLGWEVKVRDNGETDRPVRDCDQHHRRDSRPQQSDRLALRRSGMDDFAPHCCLIGGGP
jgi:Autoinducer synthase